jgi:hypothetical protein
VADFALHVGIRKSATTWLQNIFFPRLTGVNYIGKTDTSYPPWLIHWHYWDDFEFAKRFGEIVRAIENVARQGLINLISSEAFTNTAAIWSQAHRIKKLLPDARIIITLRDPVEVLISHYKLDVSDGHYHLPLEAYLDWSRTPFDLVKRSPLYLPDFFYDEMIALYCELFGAHNVCILRYEDMINSPSLYFSALSSFLRVSFPSEMAPHMQTRLNAGAQDQVTRLERSRNIRRYLSSHYPAVSLGLGDTDFLTNIEEEIVSPELRKKLERYFSGKCFGYY